MTKQKFTHEDLKSYVLENFSDEIEGDALNIGEHIEDYYEDFMQYIALDTEKDYTECDFWNDQDAGGAYFCDQASAFAESNITIYNQDLYERAWHLSEYTEEAMQDMGTPDTIVGIFQQGEYQFYSQVAYEFLKQFENFFNNNN